MVLIFFTSYLWKNFRIVVYMWFLLYCNIGNLYCNFSCKYKNNQTPRTSSITARGAGRCKILWVLMTFLCSTFLWSRNIGDAKCHNIILPISRSIWGAMAPPAPPVQGLLLHKLVSNPSIIITNNAPVSTGIFRILTRDKKTISDKISWTFDFLPASCGAKGRKEFWISLMLRCGFFEAACGHRQAWAKV